MLRANAQGTGIRERWVEGVPLKLAWISPYRTKGTVCICQASDAVGVVELDCGHHLRTNA